jgi:serine/threonine-protein kinase
MPVPTHDAFWSRVSRSGLVDGETFAALRHAHDATVPSAEITNVPAIANWLVRRGALTRWQARRLAADEPGPFFLGDYRLLDRRDRHGDALLFAARHDPTGREVSLMLLNAKRCRSVEVWTEVVRRTTAAHQATHPFLTRTWALEQAAGSRFIVCESVPGRPIADELERLGPLPPREAATVVARACRAVAELHAAGSVHGAISLDTLVRGPAARGAGERTGPVRLLQYPLVGDPHALLLRPAIGTDEEIAALGSRAAFVAPELLLPDQPCDERSDVYALGCVLHALLVGRPPCWEGDPQATLKKAAFTGLEPIGPDSGVPAEIATLVSYMTTRDPDARYQTAADAADAIVACCGLTPEEEAVAEPEPAPAVVAAAPQDVGQVVPPTEHATDAASDPVTSLGIDVGAASAVSTRTVVQRPARRVRQMQIAAVAVPAVVLLLGLLVVGPQVFRPDRSPERAIARNDRRPAGPRTPAEPANPDRPRGARPPSDPPQVDPRPTVTTEPQAAGEPEQATTAAVRQVVVDDDSLPWASPTAGPPPTLAYLPPGSQLILVARPAAIAATPEGRLFVKSLGPVASTAAATAEALCGVPTEGIEALQAGWQAGGPDDIAAGYVFRLVPGRSLPVDEAAREAAWGKTEPLSIEGQEAFKGQPWCFWIPSEERGRTLVVAPEPVLRAIIGEWQANRAAGGPIVSLPSDSETLVGMLDATRHVTLFGSPHYLVHDGRSMLSGPLANLVAPLASFFRDPVRAAALSVHFGDSVYVELDAVATAELPAVKLAPRFAAAVGRIPDAVEQYCAALDPAPYGRTLVLRLPAMLRILAANLRAGAEGRGAVVNAYLPRHAAHNLALAAELALVQGDARAVPAGGGVVAGGGGAAGRLETRITLVFAKETLEKSIQMIADEIGVPMEIRGPDLQLEGITKNQSFALEERDKPAAEILRTILAKADPAGRLVYVIRKQADTESIEITTKAAAEARGEKGGP